MARRSNPLPAEGANDRDDKMMVGKRRKKCPGISIQVRILTVLHEQGEQQPTRLARVSELSYDILQICLKSLEKNGLVTVTKTEDDHDIVRITNVGVDLLKNYQDNFSKLMKNR